MADEKGCGVRVWATLKSEDESRVLELFLSQAQVRNSTLWGSDPKQQLAYLGVKRWARLYCPDVILGVYTPDEFEPAKRTERDITSVRTSGDLNDLINQKPESQSNTAQHQSDVRSPEKSAQYRVIEKLGSGQALVELSLTPQARKSGVMHRPR